MRLPLAVLLAGFSAGSLMAGPALAMDCARATSPAEKAICADPAAIKADNAMAAAFTALHRSLDKAQARLLLIRQRRWLVQRASACDGRKGAALGACLADETQAWTARLQGRPAAGTAPGPMQPVFIGRQAKKNGDYDVNIMLLLFAAPQTPAEKAFNAAARATVADAPMSGDDGDGGDRKLAYDADMTMTLATPRLLSAAVEIYQDGGGAHPNSMTTHLNIDARSGKPLTLADVLSPDGRRKGLALCAAQVAAQRKAKAIEAGIKPEEMGPVDAKALATVFGSIDNWSFGATGATMTVNTDEIGPHAEGAYLCSFDNKTLAPLLAPGFGTGL